MGGKDPKKMTPTEVFAQQNYGQEPGGADAYQRFRELADQAKLRLGTTAPDNIKNDASAALGKFEAWRARNPAAAWATTNPGAAFVFGPTGQLASDLLGKPKAPPVSLEPNAPLEPAGPPLFTKPVHDLQTSPPATEVGLKNPGLAPGMGPGGDIYGGYGTPAGIRHAQEDTIADMGGLQEKRGEGVGAQLNVMGTKAQQFQDLGSAQAHHAAKIREAEDGVEQDRLKQEEAVQKSMDETAALGVDPGRHFKNRDAGWWLNMMVGSIAGGVLSAMQHGDKNQFIDSVRATVQQDINSQETAIEQGWRKTHGLETAYERSRVRGVDKITATIRQYDKTLEALQTDMQGKLMKAALPAEKARLEEGLQALQIERDHQAEKMQAYWASVRAQSAAAAAAAAERAWNHKHQLAELEMKQLKNQSEVEKNYAEAYKYRNGTASKTDKEHEIDKDRRAFGVHTQFLTDPKTLALTQSAPGSVTSRMGLQYQPFHTDAREYKQKLDAYNAEINTILGHWMKIEAGRVPVGEFNNVVHRFEITHNMTDAEKAARIRDLKSWVDERAKTSGVAGDVPPGQLTDPRTVKSFKPDP